MMNYIKGIAIMLVLLCVSNCDNSNDLLNEYIKDGPIIYAAKVDSMIMQSGRYRLRVNIYPAVDINRSHCILSWNVTSGIKDSIRVDYFEENFDNYLGCYYTIIDASLTENEGNLLIEAQNIDVFGNKSLVTNKGAYIYGSVYLSTLLNASVTFSHNIDKVYFEEKIGSVGNLISYEQKGGGFTDEVFVSESSYPLVNAKLGGIVRSKTKYLINKTDIDALSPTNYLETIIEDESHIEKKLASSKVEAVSNFNYSYYGGNRDYDTYGVNPVTGIQNDGNNHNESFGPLTLFNGNRATNAYYIYKFTKNGELVHSAYTTFNLNVDVKLSRVNLAPRGWAGYHYKGASPKRFRIWGTSDENEERYFKFPDTWTLIGEYVGPEPVDRDNLTPEESYYFINDNEFKIVEDNVNPSASPTKSFRYMRIEWVESYTPSDKFYVVNEFEMNGYIQKYYYDPAKQ